MITVNILLHNNKLTADDFAARLAQAKLATKVDIADFVNKTDFDNKLKIFIKKLLQKTKHKLVENELDELLEKVELISTKGLTKDLINGYSILKGVKYLSSCALQNFLVFISATKYIEI